MSTEFKASRSCLIKFLTFSGVNLFREPWTYKQKIHNLFGLISASCIVVLYVFAALSNSDRRHLTIGIISAGTACTATLFLKFKWDLEVNKTEYLKIFEGWQKRRKTLHKKFHNKTLDEIVDRNSMKGDRHAMIIIKVFYIGLAVGGIATIYMVPYLLGFIFPQLQFEKYQLPIPVHVPWLESTSWFSFGINYILQVWWSIYSISYPAAFISIELIFINYFLKELDMMKETVEEMKTLRKTKNEWISQGGLSYGQLVKVCLVLHEDLTEYVTTPSFLIIIIIIKILG